ncbi:MAG: hypothetical protein MHPSP_003140, partial [Paramarteilia canceri]
RYWKNRFDSFSRGHSSWLEKQFYSKKKAGPGAPIKHYDQSRERTQRQKLSAFKSSNTSDKIIDEGLRKLNEKYPKLKKLVSKLDGEEVLGDKSMRCVVASSAK